MTLIKKLYQMAAEGKKIPRNYQGYNLAGLVKATGSYWKVPADEKKRNRRKMAQASRRANRKAK